MEEPLLVVAGLSLEAEAVSVDVREVTLTMRELQAKVLVSLMRVTEELAAVKVMVDVLAVAIV